MCGFEALSEGEEVGHEREALGEEDRMEEERRNDDGEVTSIGGGSAVACAEDGSHTTSSERGDADNERYYFTRWRALYRKGVALPNFSS